MPVATSQVLQRSPDRSDSALPAGSASARIATNWELQLQPRSHSIARLGRRSRAGGATWEGRLPDRSRQGWIDPDKKSAWEGDGR
jgi:hypothetical protein